MPEAFSILMTTLWSETNNAVTTITNSAILLIPVGFVFAGGVIGIAKSLMGTRRKGRR